MNLYQNTVCCVVDSSRFSRSATEYIYDYDLQLYDYVSPLPRERRAENTAAEVRASRNEPFRV